MAPKYAHLAPSCFRPGSAAGVLEPHCSCWPSWAVLKLSVAGLPHWYHSFVVGWVVGALHHWHPASAPAVHRVLLEHSGCLFLAWLQLGYYKPQRKRLPLFKGCFWKIGGIQVLYSMAISDACLLWVHLLLVIFSLVECIGSTKKRVTLLY